jgi:hypothetical protein
MIPLAWKLIHNVIKNGISDAIQWLSSADTGSALQRYKKETTMLRLTATIGAMLFLGSGWVSGEIVPRFTKSAADYVLMPLVGYLVLIVAAHFAARLLPETQKS